jgi:hypothetical protein
MCENTETNPLESRCSSQRVGVGTIVDAEGRWNFNLDKLDRSTAINQYSRKD